MKSYGRFKHPLAEVFGYPVDNFSPEAKANRKNRLCPYNNKGANCTKDKANSPLGVCSIYEDDTNTTIICPIRFRQNWQIAVDAASFFFPKEANWTSLTEVRLNDKDGLSAGNVDSVLVSYDNRGRLLDFGALEVQAVYISGNIRRLFERYIENPEKNYRLDWSGESNCPRADYLSSSRKRLVPQLIYKGAILKAWNKKVAVAIHESFYNTLPELAEVSESEGDIAWMVYCLEYQESSKTFKLRRKKTVFTLFEPSMKRITTSEAGPVEEFLSRLQDKLDEKLEGSPPDAPSLGERLEG